MTAPSEENGTELAAQTLGTLHILAVKGAARTDLLAAADGRGVAELTGELELLQDRGYATHLPKRNMWRISADGRSKHAAVLEHEVPAAVRPQLDAEYHKFLSLNHRFKALCTRWQVRDGGPNDHCDPGYDGALVEELGEVHQEAAQVITQLDQARGHLGRYQVRLAQALERVRGGELKAFTGVLTESYHEVWMDLHRDLLLTLRIDREDEATAGNITGAAR